MRSTCLAIAALCAASGCSPPATTSAPTPPRVATGPQVEPFEASDANGHLVSRGFRTRRADGNYVRTGKWTYYFPDGRVQEEGEYEDDLKIGRWVFHKIYSAYGGGLKHGEYYLSHEEDYEAGELTFKRLYSYSPLSYTPGKPYAFTEGAIVRNMKEGKWPTTTTEGVKISENLYKANKVVGWELMRPTGEPFARFENGVYTLRGEKQEEKTIPEHRDWETEMWQSYCTNAWQHATKELKDKRE